MKIWKITCCDMCPKIGRVHQINTSYNYCYREHKSLSEVDTLNAIPKWCPLPDYKEKDNVDNNK